MADATTSVDINSISDYQLLRDGYRGSGGFKTGAYLVPHHREKSDAFGARCRNTPYLNYLKPVVDSHYRPIFRREIDRQSKGNTALFDLLKLNVDKAGTSINPFMRKAARMAKRDSILFLSVSAPTQAPTTAADQRDKTPWAFMIRAEAVQKAVRDEWGRVVSLSWAFEHKGERVIRTLTGQGWVTQDDKGELVQGEGLNGEWATPYPTAPVVVIAPGEWDDDEALPTPEFLCIARANARIYNAKSEYTEISRNATFPILTYPAKDLKEIVIGTNNVMGYDPSQTHEPAWISPDSAPSEVLRTEIADLVTEIYRMAELSHAVAKKDGTQAQSGVAKQLDREGLDSALSEFSKHLQEAEIKLWDLFSWISGTEISVSVSYPQQFTSGDIEIELPAMESALAIGAGPTFAGKVRKRMARLILPSSDQEDMAAIDEEIDGMAQAEQNSPPPDQNTPPDETDPNQQTDNQVA
jgi:hypothetical protein